MRRVRRAACLGPSLALLLLLGCDGGAKPTADASDEAGAGNERPGPGAPEPEPEPEPLKAIEGAVADEGRRIHVQACTEAVPCPKLLQAAGETQCAELDLDGKGWRLPTRDEAKGFKDLAGLFETEGFHWTGTAFADDDAQRWIFDPGSGSETTVPRDRKSFTVRCVRDAEGG